jgi:predicted transcriptional regulator
LRDKLRVNDAREPETIMKPLPQSSKTVLRILGTDGAMTHKDIVRKTHCSPRTIRYALRKLKENNLIIEKMNMRDMRQIIYQDRMVTLSAIGVPDSYAGSCEGPRPSSTPVG